MSNLYQLRTFADIVAAVREELGISSTDTVMLNAVKRSINEVYQEVVAHKNWKWLEGNVTLQLPAYINAGTVSVTQGSAAITLTSAPNASQTGKYFATEGFSEIYLIESHVAGSTSAKLSELFSGATDSAANYKLWADRIPLPTDCRETNEVWHDYHSIGLEPRGKQDLRKIILNAPRAEGRPVYYCTGDFIDPSTTSAITSLPATLTRSSSGVVKSIVFASALPTSLVTAVTDGKPYRLKISAASSPSYNGDVIISSIATTTVTNDTITYTGKAELQESSTSDTSISVRFIDQQVDYDRYRELYLYPCLNNTRTTIHVDYIKEVFPLENDSDEPVIPKEDRMILVYGARALAWAKNRNSGESDRNYAKYQQKMAQMAGKHQDTMQMPRLQPSKIYLGAKRNISGRQSLFGRNTYGAISGGSSGQVVTGTANRIAQFGATGELEASSLVSTTEAGYLDNVTSNIQTQLDAITTLADGKIYLGNNLNVATEITPSGDATISNTGVIAITADVIVDADINTSAAITRSKTASGTAYRILANNSSGVMAENAALTASQVVVSDANGQLSTIASLPAALNSASLTDNTTVTAASWTVATYDTIIITYSLKRGSANHATGKLFITTDGTNASIAEARTEIGTLGVSFTVDISGASLRLRATQTSTGTAATMKYLEEKWLS